LAARGIPPKRLAANAAARLLNYPWPGNVRELRNAMERVTALVRRPVIVAADLDFLVAARSDEATSAELLAGTLPEVIARIETEMIQRALTASGGNRAQAAERLGIRRQLLYQKLARYGLDLSPNRTERVSEGDIEAREDPFDHLDPQ